MKNKMPISRLRGIVAFAALLVIVVNLATHLGVGTWSSFGLGYIASICPLGALEVMLGAKTVMLHPLVLLIATAVLVVIVGKAFCAWVCPVPWIDRFFHPAKKKGHDLADGNAGHEGHAGSVGHAGHGENAVVADAAFAAPESVDAPAGNEAALHLSAEHSCSGHGCQHACALSKVGGERDGMQLDSRHFTLFGALASAAVFGFPVFCLICPIGLTAATFVGVWHLFQFGETSWGLLAFPAILLVEIVFFRKWCAKICPMGALMSLISGANRTFKPKVDETRCMRSSGIDCRACVEACPEKVDPHGDFIPECTKCGACMDACPAHAIKIRALG